MVKKLRTEWSWKMIIFSFIGAFMLFYLSILVVNHFSNNYSKEVNIFSMGHELKAKGTEFCLMKGFHDIYQVTLIKGEYYSVDCERIYGNKFYIENFDVWKKDFQMLKGIRYDFGKG